MTATQVARNVAGLLDDLEHGEEIVITRDGVTVGRAVPEHRTAAQRLEAALAGLLPDPQLADATLRALAEMNQPPTTHAAPWPDE